MAPSSKERGVFRCKFLAKIRRRIQRHSGDARTPQPQRSCVDSEVAHDPLLKKPADDSPPIFVADLDDGAHTRTNKGTSRTSHHERNAGIRWTLADNDCDVTCSLKGSDIWSAAYGEAVLSFGKDLDNAILKADGVAQLFRELDEIDKEAYQESAFRRGVEYLQSIQVPLERFKLALDIAGPVGYIEPIAGTCVGIVRSVTTIAISFATADLEFGKQIGEMLKQISYIDDCDTLGQRTNQADIHKALVSVYQKILEFYKVAHEILTNKGIKLMMKMILATNRLPGIVQDFLGHTSYLRQLVQKATWEIVEDIKLMLYDSEIVKWLGGEKMRVQSQHHARLQDLRDDEACQFLLKHPNFINWYNSSDSQQLVILGDMGCGKSVTMAFLVDELIRRKENQLPKAKLCYHYCRDDDTGHAVYIFSAIILSLLEQLPGLKKTFYEWYKQNKACRIVESAEDLKKLEEFLEMILETLDRPLFLLVDGLDECHSTSRNELLQSLKNLSRKTPRLKIILSSRPEEEILKQLEDMARIDLGPDAYRDAVIVRHTVEKKLSSLSENVAELVKETLSQSAQGSAIWTKMVVELIAIRKISALEPMRRFLAEMSLPGELSKLYATLISRYSTNDPENERLAVLALKLLAAAYRPLSIQELAWGVALAAAPHEVTTVVALAQLVDHHRLLSLIQPFIARLDFDDLGKRQIRLVHQSVKEFIVRELDLLRGFAAEDAESLEAFMLDVCIDYLLLDNIGNSSLFSEEQVAIDGLPQEDDIFGDLDPSGYDHYCTWEVWEENMIRYDPAERGFGHFFVYASCNWLKHYRATERASLLHLTKIESLCQVGSTRLDNWTAQNCRPDCVIKARFDFDGRSYDPLGITSLYGSDTMLRYMLQNSKFENDKFFLSPAKGAADQILRWGDLYRLRILFSEGKLCHQLQNLDTFQLIMRRWSDPTIHHNDWDLAFDLVDCVLDTLVQDRWGNDLLCVAARAGCMPIIQRLLDRAQYNAELMTELLRGCQSIGEAVLGNHPDVVEYLLGREGFETHLQHLTSRGENVLHLASMSCNPAIFRLLVPRLPKGILQTDSQGDTVLMWVVKSQANPQDRYDSARLLLSQDGIDWNSGSADWQQNLLQVAVQLGDIDMCRLLIRDGRVDPLLALTQGDHGQLVLKDIPWKNDDAILQLLRTHVNIVSIL